MRTKVKEGMTLDKKREVQEKRRLTILEALVKETPFTLPAILIDAELGKLMMQFKMDLERMGVAPADYFAKLGKSEEELAKDMRPDAEKRARIQLIINEIALAEKIVPTKEEVEKEVEHIFEGHEPHDGHDEADERERATIYIMTVLTNEKVLKFLEELV
jgi:trigger factor